MDTTPKVSICIPAYKQTHQLKKTLDSILIQKFLDYELIISDDSPDDRVEKLVHEYNFGTRLIYWRNCPAKGSPENWNEALRKAKGEYIKLIHHDDWFTCSESLGLFIGLLEKHPEADFAFCAAYSWFEENTRKELYSPGATRIEPIRTNPLLLLSANVIGAPSALIIRKKAMQLYDPALVWLVDIENYIRMIAINNQFAYTTEPLMTNLADEAERMTGKCLNNPAVEIREHFYVYQKHKSLIAANQRQSIIIHLLNLVVRLNMKTIADIRQNGFTGPLPGWIRFFFVLKGLCVPQAAKWVSSILKVQSRRQHQLK